MQDFAVDGYLTNVWGYDFQGSEQTYSIGQSPKIECNLFKNARILLKG